ncbi:CapA family protein [candidate division KSB1 bacterium]|nr:CapA family protein [candidate division KSB1 bacterium]MBL7093401.1 CapA family protein [candidate division KSB1 bacterium]
MRRFFVFFLTTILFFSCHSNKQVSRVTDPKPFVFQYPGENISYRLPLDTSVIFDFVSIAAVGDVMYGNHTISYIKKHGTGYPFVPTGAILQNADVAFANLEAPFTDTGTKFDKRFTFKVPPKYATGLTEAGFDVVTLANNHMLDYGIEGLANTLKMLDSIGVAHCGAGLDLKQAREPAIIERNGFRIAVLGYSLTFPQEFWATNSTGGTCYPHYDYMQKSIQQSDSLADFTIVTFHWGSELKNYPKKYQKDYAHLAIDNGADLVLGHHPHVLQGLEIYKNRLIAYSLGNFSFASYSAKATESIILKAHLSKAGLLYAKVIPVSVNNSEVAFQPKPLTGAAADIVIAHLKIFSKPLNSKSIIDKDGYVWGDWVVFKNKYPFSEALHHVDK